MVVDWIDWAEAVAVAAAAAVVVVEVAVYWYQFDLIIPSEQAVETTQWPMWQLGAVGEQHSEASSWDFG